MNEVKYAIGQVLKYLGSRQTVGFPWHKHHFGRLLTIALKTGSLSYKSYPYTINMKIVNIIGGLGNQLFQYAFAVALQEEFPEEEVKICIKSFKGYPLHNGYELDNLFDIQLGKASFWDLCKVAYPWVNYKICQRGNKLLP